MDSPGEKLVIRHGKNNVIRVEHDGDGRGKILVSIWPKDGEGFHIFHVALSWESIEKIKEAALCDLFLWETRDHSLKIQGKGKRWSLVFSHKQSGLVREVTLTEKETRSLTDVLRQSSPGVDD